MRSLIKVIRVVVTRQLFLTMLIGFFFIRLMFLMATCISHLCPIYLALVSLYIWEIWISCSLKKVPCRKRLVKITENRTFSWRDLVYRFFTPYLFQHPGRANNFVNNFLSDIVAVVKSHAEGIGGNAVVNFYLNECLLTTHSHKNQVRKILLTLRILYIL